MYFEIHIIKHNLCSVKFGKTVVTLLSILCLMNPAFGQDYFKQDTLSHPRLYSEELVTLLNYSETATYQLQNDSNTVFLENGYGLHPIINGSKWKALKEDNKPYRVDIIYTKYPFKFEDWNPNYFDLLANRLIELFEIDSNLNIEGISWNLILQTNCHDPESALRLPHGIKIWYYRQLQTYATEYVVNIDKDVKIETQFDSIKHQKQVNMIATKYNNGDSTVIKILNRNPQWKNMLIVIDWTSSMYAYGGQAVLWQALNTTDNGIKYYVFFNDGDDKKYNKILGRTGGIYYTDARNLDQVIGLMQTVKRNGDGGDIPENDIEALLHGTSWFTGFDEIILIADNNSPIRDFALLDQLTQPIRVIVCGVYDGINPQYMNLAYKTKGSIHTIERDIFDLISRMDGGIVTINNIAYQLNSEDLFVPTKGKVSPLSILNNE